MRRLADPAATAGIAFMTVVAAALAVITLTAWWRDRRPRFALLAAAFLLFFLKALALSWGLWSGVPPVRLLAVGAGVDAVFLAVLYVALVKR